MSRAEYIADYRKRKSEGTFTDKRRRHFPSDYCLNCGTELKRHRSTKPRKYCSNDKCQHEHARKTAIDMGIAGSGSTKRYLIETRGDKCECCGISEWQSKKLVLELDHINGDFNNNALDNVRLLCPNCHSLTPTFKAKNTGNGRSVNDHQPKPFYPRLSDQLRQTNIA